MSERPEFSVYQFFLDESCEEELSLVGLEQAMDEAKRLTETLGARRGTTRRVIITDGGDCTVFEWQYGKGVTFT